MGLLDFLKKKELALLAEKDTTIQALNMVIEEMDDEVANHKMTISDLRDTRDAYVTANLELGEELDLLKKKKPVKSKTKKPKKKS
jgi:hypothetical protein